MDGDGRAIPYLTVLQKFDMGWDGNGMEMEWESLP